MRPTRNPMYELAWKQIENQSAPPCLAKPHERYNPKICYYCNKSWGKGRKRTRQHLLPKRRGGLYEVTNLRWCCDLCNQLLNTVDDCPVVFNVYKQLISESPLKHLPLRIGFTIYLAMKRDICNKFVQDVIAEQVSNLKHKKKKYIARQILIYMKSSFPGSMRNSLSKEEIPLIFFKNASTGRI